MRFFRRRPNLALLALLALATQAALSFGHTHAHARSGFGGLETRAITFGHCGSMAKQACPRPGSEDRDAACAICWTMGLAGSLVLHAPPSISLPAYRNETPAPLYAAVRLAADDTIHFRARAPPRALSA
jgi:hypothetical protein